MSGRERSISAIAFALLLSAGCSVSEGAATSATEFAATTVADAVVTIRVNWDRHCDVSWTLSYDGRLWKSPTSRMLEEERTGSVESVIGGILTYRDDDGTAMTFVIDDPRETVCS